MSQTTSERGFNSCLVSIAGLIFGGLLAAGLLYFVSQRFFGTGSQTFDCAALPAVDRTAELMAEHSQLRDRIQAAGEGPVTVEVDTETCPGKAGLVIWYQERADRTRIERLIQGDTFFGVPYIFRRY